MKIGTVLKNEKQYLAFMINENTAISSNEINKNFEMQISKTMQEFIAKDFEKYDEIECILNNVRRGVEDYKLIDLSSIEWQAPNPDARKILGVAFNNKNIRKEVHIDPGCPNYFLKSSSCLIGHNNPILIRNSYGNTIPEPELCLVIGKTGKDINREKALDYVFGYSIMNDITSHGMKFSMDSVAVTRDPKIMKPEFINWRKYGEEDKNDLYFVYHTRSKSSDTFGPMGPWVTTANEINNPNNIRIHAYKNGECYTDDSTSSYRFSIEELISNASHYFTLEPGDIISCGTAAKGNKNFPNAHRNILLNEEECELKINIDGLGTLTNPVKHTQ